LGALLGVIGLYLLPSSDVLLVASTTSLYDTGLLDILGHELEEDLGTKIKFIATGTGLALRNARRGDVDAVLVHAPSSEESFLMDGEGVNRKTIAYNFFVILGPSGDPAGIAGAPVEEAMRAVRKKGLEGDAIWVSRGDGSGTQIKESLLWEAAGLDPEEIRHEDWYLEVGSGMGNTLRVANEKQAYTISDTGTYLKYFSRNLVSLQSLVSAGKELINVYSIIAVSPVQHPNANFEGAMKLISWLSSREGQSFIGAFGEEEYGLGLFSPINEATGNESASEVLSWIREYAHFEGSECPPEYRYEEGGLY
jgi:tungstate transport system substrate-binding protein